MGLLVTISAIMEYLDKANQAQEKLEEANAKMNNAAAELLNLWQGEAADAFREEQETLKGFIESLLNVGINFMEVIRSVVEKYTEMEAANQNKFRNI